ncbi:hypothetical protein PG984_003432 [Apiospora sp. TS-2023a]
MWLCVMELWVACDQAATQQVPLLLDYSIGFPNSLLEPLVLPPQSQMSRLRKIERHLKEREVRAQRGYPSAFEGFGQANSFAARYYDSFDSHQRLYQEIMLHAETGRREKHEELRQRLAEYEALKLQFEGTAHDQEVTRMSRMSITVHEWPLPDNDIEAHGVVFELQVPSVISDWRRVTITVLVDLLQDNRRTARGADKCYSPLDYPKLAMRAWGGPQGRLGLASQVKPFTVSHYRDQAVSEASIHTICKMHGCHYTYHDNGYSQTVSELVESSKISSNCSFAAASRLPLPDWIRGYSHTSNEVIAHQSACPANMALDEFKAIGHMRSGARLQWWNILVQLYAPIQAIGEGGPYVDDPDSHLRDAHAVVQDEVFARKFLDGLQTALLRFRENWECATALFILVSLCNRVMALANSEDIWSACCHFGRQIRSVACHWANTLLNKRAETDSEVERSDLNDRILAMALVSSSTFDTDIQHAARVLNDGSKVLEIAPSDEPGLDYTAVRKQQGWIVHFGMVNEELIVRACADGSTWEFVPPWFLRADLPDSLILPYSHWRNTQTGELELHNVERPWSARDSLWRSQVHPQGHVALVCGDMSIIEPRRGRSDSSRDDRPVSSTGHVGPTPVPPERSAPQTSSLRDR